MKVFFVKDPGYDGLIIWDMLKESDPSGVKNRAKSMGINEEIFAKIHGKQWDEAKSVIIPLVNERYKKENAIIDKAIIEYQKAWDKINENFFKEVEKITREKWKFDHYEVVVSPFHRGISNRTENIVIRSAYENPEDQKRITAHEILMTHIWNIFDERHPEAEEDPKLHFWALNEISTIAILGLEPSLNILWTEKKQGYDQYLANYPQLEKLKKELKEAYLNKRSFLEFIEEAMRKIELKYQNIDFGF